MELLPDINTNYVHRIKEIRELLQDPMIVRLCETDIYQAISLRSMAAFEHFLKERFRSRMDKILSFIHEVDVFIAVSDVARSANFSYADAVPAAENVFHARDIRHPAIPGAIGNDIKMDHSRNVLFLTGANMAGKSTLMKSIGTGIYLAHMGFPVAASALTFSVRQGIYTSINTADNIGMGYSHFYAEVMRVKEAAEAVSSGKDLLLIFDEMFKGTNVKDAYDGTFTVTEAFAEYRNCLLIVSTHIIEVGVALKENEHIQFAYMPTVMEDNRPRYTYRLEEGITEDRQGMMIIRNEGILEMIAGK
jgi:DNA mismatch repair ATPase MutS